MEIKYDDALLPPITREKLEVVFGRRSYEQFVQQLAYGLYVLNFARARFENYDQLPKEERMVLADFIKTAFSNQGVFNTWEG